MSTPGPDRDSSLIDVHQIGRGSTGNETWARNVARILEGDGGRPVHYAVSPEGLTSLSGALGRLHLVAGSSCRRLLLDVPRLLRATRCAAVLSQYTLPVSKVPGVVAIHDLSFVTKDAAEWIPSASLMRYRASIGASARRAKVVVVPTEYTRQHVIEHYGLSPDRVLLAPLALDPELAQLLAQSTKVERSYRTILCVGTLLPRKNLPVVAKAVAALRRNGDDVRLRLVGPVRPAGEQHLGQMRELLGEALQVKGPVSLDQLAQEYRSADAFAFPSMFEGFGLPLLEAMAAGVPTVSSTSTCLPEVGADGVLLADPRDEAAWTKALSQLLSDPAGAAGLRERGKRRSADFSWHATGQVVRNALDLAAAS